MRKTQYLDLAATIANAIQTGRLTPGTKLPTHRSFAEECGVAVATATRTYKELERRGLVIGEKGRGVFVRDPSQSTVLALEQTAPDGLIDLVCNIPSEKTDTGILRSGLKRLAGAGDLDAMLRYQPPRGRAHERKIIATYLEPTLGAIAPERVLITSGVQHGLAITALGILRQGDAIATDQLTYPGFKSLAALHGFKLVPIAEQNGCMDVEALERACTEHKISAVYLMPTVQNPLGSVMDEATRHRLLDVANRHDLLLIEDSAYAYLEPDPPISFAELAPDRTILVGSFSKSFATGLRLGYLVSPIQHCETLAHVIRATVWNTPAVVSALITGWVEDGTLRQVEETRRQDGAKRQRLCRRIFYGNSITSHRNASVVWLPLKAGMRAAPLISQLGERGIAVSSAEPFAVTRSPPQALRLAFGGFPEGEMIRVLEEVREVTEAVSSGWTKA